MAERACVTGMGVVSALGCGVDATWAALEAGRCAERLLAELTFLIGVELHGHVLEAVPHEALGVGSNVRRYMSPAMQALHVATREALASARLTGEPERLASFGIAVGAQTGERSCKAEMEALRAGEADGVRRPSAPALYARALLARSPLSALRAQPGLLAGMLSQLHGITGPCLTLIDEGTAGNGAIAEACLAIETGWCDGWIAGGTFDLDDPWILIPRARRATPLGSAAAVLVLEGESKARERCVPILATITARETDGEGARSGPEPQALARWEDPQPHPQDVVRWEHQLGHTRAAAFPLAVVLAIRGGAVRISLARDESRPSRRTVGDR